METGWLTENETETVTERVTSGPECGMWPVERAGGDAVNADSTQHDNNNNSNKNH